MAVVLLNYNGRHWLERFLPSVLRYSPSGSVYVIDNASTDESLSYLRDQLPSDRIISLAKNQGYAAGYNEGLRRIEVDYYALLNTDVQVSEGWWQPLLSYMESAPQVGACQPKIHSYGSSDPPLFDYAGAAGGYIDLLGYPYCRGRIFESIEADRGQYDGPPQPCDWASGACLLLRAAAFWEVGGFDARFFMHMEEIDLCWRLHLAKYSVYCCTESCVSHVGGGSLPMHSPRKTFYNFRNNLLLLYKHLPLRRMWVVFPLRFVLDALAVFYFCLRGRAWAAVAIIRAYVVAMSWCVRLSCSLSDVKRSSTGALLFPKHHVYIVCAYFLRARRRYSSLGLVC